MPNPWALLAMFENHLTLKLLRSPTFHRIVGVAHRKVRHMRHGVPPEEMGATNLDDGKGAGVFLRHFKEELQNQLRELRGGKAPPSTQRPPDGQGPLSKR